MTYKTLTPRKSLNKAFLKVKPNRTQIDRFKMQLSSLLHQIKEGESEEFHKNIIADFLKKTYYDPDYYINTKGRNDLVVHNGKNTKNSVGVIIEAKSPTNKAEMPQQEKINTKALQELLLYFLRERINESNTEVRHLVVTNINEWFIFDAHLFDTLFAQDKKLVKKFKDFEAGTLSATNTDHFYKEIAQPAIEAVEHELSFTYFNVTDYEKSLKSGKEDDSKLIVLYKLLSPEHLLKLPFANDSNSLDKGFYNELLYIMGLEEFQEKGKKLIQRKAEKERIYGTLLESVISKLESRGELHRLDNPQQYGKNTEERLFSVGLQLVITWLNRVLFLKLLEAQLLDYNKGDKSYSFLNIKRIGNFNKLADLFFNVLAVPNEKRKPAFQEAFAKVPYLNSSLFEANALENRALHIDTLDASETIPVYKSTVLKDDKGKRLTGEMPVLEYLFAFLEAYDFSSEGSEEIQEENKKLINASVLGLIFEKINGYKDGSFFTPGFITMYMCRETIRRAVVEKFNTHFKWKCKDFGELKEDLLEEIKNSDLGRDAVRTQANELINALKICDPAVGSGHFLVSALNELITIKHDLRILCDRSAQPLSDYQISIENDELIITDLEDRLFSYNPTDAKSQRMQEALFHEKQELIENCLFGVDINPNSVKICRLRLWIELLKSAYYKQKDSGIRELETLPNIDINIKTGNSLISRFGLDEDLSKALKKSKWNISTYRNAVDSYRNATSKDEKRDMERLINDIKSDFRTEINKNDPKIKRKAKLAGELYNLTMQQGLFEVSKAEQKKRKKQIDKLEADINKLESDIEEIKSNVIYENAFEWRFEFPEVLDDEGNFVGFDVVIGNPPYFVFESKNSIENELNYYKSTENYKHALGGKLNAYKLFLALAPIILKKEGLNCQIFQISFLADNQAKNIRKHYLNNQSIIRIDAFPERDNENKRVFEEAKMSVCILLSKNLPSKKETFTLNISYDRKIRGEEISLSNPVINSIDSETLSIPLAEKIELELLIKVQKSTSSLGKKIKCFQGELNVSTHKKYFQDNPNDYLLVKGAQVQKFFLTDTPSQGKIEYVKIEEYLNDFKNPKSLHHLNKRIVMQGITGVNEKIRIKATLLDEKCLCGHSCNYIITENSNTDEIFHVIGLLNSKLLNWIFKMNSTNSNVNSYEIENLPFLNDETLQISQQVKNIIFLKKQNNSADTASLEQEIDQIVYELYGLTEEEIKIVEGGVG